MSINVSSQALKITGISLLIAASFAFSNTANAQSLCSNDIMQESRKQSQQELKEELEHIENVYKGYMEQPDWLGKSNGLLAGCSNANWPDWASSIFNFPVLSKLKDGAGQVTQACDKARAQIGKASSAYGNTVGKIDGYQNMIGGSGAGGQSALGGLWGQQPGSNLNLPPGTGSVDNWGIIDGIINGGQVPNIPGVSGNQPPNQSPKPITGIPGITNPIVQ